MKTIDIARKAIGWAYYPTMNAIRKYRHEKQVHRETDKIISLFHSLSSEKQHIYYLGITCHSNLGDMAQHFCIRRWIDENYPNAEQVLIPSDIVVNTRYGFMNEFERVLSQNDVIVFQSGYTTQDLGGNHDYMHRLIVEKFPKAHILMMPQTIYFQSEENKVTTAKILNSAHNMLFLARDEVSYSSAKDMFPDIEVRLFPDIVTTLIGTQNYGSRREGVCFCLRNDGEKFYSDDDLTLLRQKIEKTERVTLCDTTIKVPYMTIRNNMPKYILGQAEMFSHFKVVITDRYHGTILSLVGGTPVIIIKTTDHKVVTGADWFKGIYDDYVHVAENLDDAYLICEKLSKMQFSYRLPSYFKNEYYDKLKIIFENTINKPNE